jgi:hypothetical protein
MLLSFTVAALVGKLDADGVATYYHQRRILREFIVFCSSQ